MIITELVRNKKFFASLHNESPFVWAGYTGYYEYTDNWGTNLGDEITTTGKRHKVMQVSQDYLSMLTRVDTLSECLATQSTWYFDRSIEKVYIHVEHSSNPLTSIIDYGYAMGFCSQSAGVTYIDDSEYLPLIKSVPGIEQESDVVGASKPTGVTGSIELDNHSNPDPISGVPRGELDFLIEESIFGNDVFLYKYKDDILYPKASFYIEDYELSEESISLNLQDKRFE